MRGIERLAAVGDTRSIEKLLELVEGELAGTRHPAGRLVAVRGLAKFADNESVAMALGKVLSNESPRGPLATLIRDAAAMGLAAAGGDRCLELLTTALRQGGPAGLSAKDALLAHPPSVLLSFQPDAVPPLASELFGELRDARAKEPLRTTLSRARSVVPMHQAMATSAAIALARLKDESVVEVARSWVAHDDAGLKLAGAQVLAILEAKEAGEVVAALLGPDRTRGKALELAILHPSPALVGSLVGIARAGDPQSRDKAIAALGKVASPEALIALESMLADGERGLSAARALAIADSKKAAEILERALGSVRTRRRAAQALTARFLIHGEAPSALKEALSALVESPNAGDRWAGSLGLAVTRPRQKAELARSGDRHVMRAAALSMSAEEASRFVPTEALLAFVGEDSPLGLWAMGALGFRDGARVRPRLEAHLASSEPKRRAKTARGWAESLRPDVSARLARAYAFEVEPEVRLAIVEALAERKEPQRTRTLELAASLDGDAAVRHAARRALDPSAKGATDDEARRAAILDLAFSALAEKSPAP